MFELCNVYIQNAGTTIMVRRHDEELEFILTPLISKRNKTDLNEKTQFEILNAYVDYKGDAFKDALMTVLSKCNDDVMETLTVNDIYPLPYHIVHPILDLFDLQDVFNFLKFEFKLKPPSELLDVFDPKIESDSRGTRVQTYLKDDYLELAALATIFKVAMLPVFNYAYIKQEKLGSMNKEYILFHLFKKHPLYQSDPMVKIRGLIQKLIEQTTTTGSVDAIRVLEKQIPRDELPFYVLGIVMIQKVSIASLVEDDNMKNIVTKVYNYVNNKLKSAGDVSKCIRNKTTLKDVDGLPGDSESYIESHRQLHAHSPSDIVEFEWAVNSIDMVISQLPPRQKSLVDVELAKKTYKNCEVFKKGHILPVHISLLSIIFKSIIDPRSLDYIKVDTLLNLFSVGFSYLWGMGQKNLALILTAIPDTSIKDNIMVINSTVNKTRLSKELKEELDYFFPYKKVINEETHVNLAEETIGYISEVIYDHQWIPTADKELVSEVIGDGNFSKLVPSDFKVNLAEFIIQNERNIIRPETLTA